MAADLARAVGRTLTKHQTDRYGSADDLLADLRAVKQDRERRVSPEGVSDTLLPSIAVLPFADMSPQKDQDYFCEGLAEELIEALRQATILAPDDPSSLALFGWGLGLAGRRHEVLTILGKLERRRTQEYFSGFLMALVSVGLGERDQAISWLEKAAEERDWMLTFLNRCPEVDPLRADPRFHALLRRMNFPETAGSG